MADRNLILESDVDSSLGAGHQHQPEIDVNPNQRLSFVLLNEFNYLPWSRAVSLTLGGRSKLRFINGSIEAHDTSSSTYESWLNKDQLVMSWLLNSMERKIAEIFSYSESSLQLWKSVQEMYGNQNNAARVFQLKRDIGSKQQDGKPFIQLLRSLKATFLMNSELPTFANVCAIIQREELRKKVMNTGTTMTASEARAYFSNDKKYFSSDKKYKGRNPYLKCKHCDATGHVRDHC
ncbi:uncharacterized protein [Pyrus communis]|uniref:uncharacterized protein n=1 Tax=Pyrus communis TaxID=23211 RepID=UPI0035BEE2DB